MTFQYFICSSVHVSSKNSKSVCISLSEVCTKLYFWYDVVLWIKNISLRLKLQINLTWHFIFTVYRDYENMIGFKDRVIRLKRSKLINYTCFNRFETEYKVMHTVCNLLRFIVIRHCSILHKIDVTMSSVAFQITGVSIICQSLVQPQIKENIKALAPVRGMGDRWIPLTGGFHHSL